MTVHSSAVPHSGSCAASANADRFPTLTIRLLGGFTVDRGDEHIPEGAWRRRNAVRLVKLLSLEPEHRLHRDRVIDTLWPDSSPNDGLNAYRQALHHARRALWPHASGSANPYLVTAEEMVSLSSLCVVDCDAFLDAAGAALRHPSIQGLEAALSLYTGELLPSDLYEPWVENRRREIVDRQARVVTMLASIHLEQGRPEQAQPLAEALIRSDPLNEEAHRLLISALNASGRRSAALQVYDAMRSLLHEELGIEPENESQELRAAVAEGTLRESPARLAADLDIQAPASPLAGMQYGIRSAPLVGRDTVLHVLESFLLVEAHDPRFLLVGGEAGVGKTRLASELAEIASQRGLHVLWGAAYEEDGLFPYGPFIDAMDRAVRGLGPEEQSGLAERFPDVAGLLPSLSGQVTAAAKKDISGERDDIERTRLFAEVAGFLNGLAGSGTMLLVLDDLHLADAASLHLLRYLANPGPGRPWLILGTYREEDVAADSGFRRLATTLTRAGHCRRIDLLRLARDDCDRLVRALMLGREPDSQMLDYLYALTLGNALFLQEMVREIEDEGIESLPATRSRPHIPDQVRELLSSRYQRLSRPAREALSIAAAHGPETQYSVLRAVSAADDATLLDALDEAVAARMLTEAGGVYTFAHPLQRAVVYETLSYARRAISHGRIAAVLETDASDTPPELLAHHFSLSVEPARAIPYLEQAGDRARRVFAHDVAATHYRDALSLLPDTSDSREERARLSDKLGETLLTAGQYQNALPLLEEAALTFEVLGDLDSRARVLATIGRLHLLQGTPAEGIARIEEVRSNLEMESSGAAALYAALAPLYRAVGRYDDQIAAASRAAVVACRLGDGRTHGEALQWQAYALLATGCKDEGVRLLERAAQLAEQHNDQLTLSRALNGLAAEWSDRGEFEREREYLARALRVAEQLGDPSRIAFMTFRRGENSLITGNWEAAERDFQTALETSRKLGTTWVTPYALCGLGALACYRGNLADARSLLNECLALGQREDAQILPQAQLLLAECDIAEGLPADAVSRLRDTLTGSGIEDVHRTYLLPALAIATLPSDRAAAREIAEQAVEKARADRNMFVLLSAQRAALMTTDSQADGDDLDTWIVESLALCKTVAYPLGASRLRLAVASALAASGRLERARDLVRESRTAFLALGATGDARAAEEMLDRIDEALSSPGDRR